MYSEQRFANPASRATKSPRHTLRAPFPDRFDHGLVVGRLAARMRRELDRTRPLSAEQRTVATCPACGEAVRGDQGYVRDRGDLYHSRCALYRTGDGAADGA